MAGEKVLIIDDSAELRATIEAVLRFGGYDPLSAGSGQEGLELVLNQAPDVILIDLELPDTTGLKVIEQFNRQGFKIPTIMMTGYGSEGTAARALRLGVRDYLVKPFTTDEVLSSIERALEENRLRSERDRLTMLLQRYELCLDLFDGVSRSIISGDDLEHVLQQVVKSATSATGAEVGFLMLLNGPVKQLRIVAACGQPPGVARDLSAQSGDERLRPVLNDGKAVRLHAEGDCSVEIQTGCVTRAVLQVPLLGKGRVMGLVAVDNRVESETFDENDEKALWLLAQFAVMALEKTKQATGRKK